MTPLPEAFIPSFRAYGGLRGLPMEHSRSSRKIRLLEKIKLTEKGR